MTSMYIVKLSIFQAKPHVQVDPSVNTEAPGALEELDEQGELQPRHFSQLYTVTDTILEKTAERNYRKIRMRRIVMFFLPVEWIPYLLVIFGFFIMMVEKDFGTILMGLLMLVAGLIWIFYRRKGK